MLWWNDLKVRVQVSIHLGCLLIWLILKVHNVWRSTSVSVHRCSFDFRNLGLKYCRMMVARLGLSWFWCSLLKIHWLTHLAIRQRRLLLFRMNLSIPLPLSFQLWGMLLNRSQMPTLLTHFFRFFFSNDFYRFRKFYRFFLCFVYSLIHIRSLVSKRVLRKNRTSSWA